MAGLRHVPNLRHGLELHAHKAGSSEIVSLVDSDPTASVASPPLAELVDREIKRGYPPIVAISRYPGHQVSSTTAAVSVAG